MAVGRPDEQDAGRHLVEVHDHLRAELDQVRDLVRQVTAGALAPGVARSRIAGMTLRQNAWTVGSYCASYCRVVTMHHLLEDQSVFPHLRRAEPALAPVLDRLQREHHVIHGVLEGLDQALVAFVGAPDAAGSWSDVAGSLNGALELLAETLLAHLAYEEGELVEPLARLGFG